LNTGDKIPAIGLGTWQSEPKEVEKAVEAALRFGYRKTSFIPICGAFHDSPLFPSQFSFSRSRI
jgi:hypothetical protein